MTAHNNQDSIVNIMNPGTSVIVIDGAFAPNEPNQSQKTMINATCTIKQYTGQNTYEVWTPDKSDFWLIQSKHLAPDTAGKKQIPVTQR